MEMPHLYKQVFEVEHGYIHWRKCPSPRYPPPVSQLPQHVEEFQVLFLILQIDLYIYTY